MPSETSEATSSSSTALDATFVRFEAALARLLAPSARPALRRHARIRVIKWLEKLRTAPCANARWRRSRNDHAALLLRHAKNVARTDQDQSAFPPPFDRNPTPGPLNGLPAHATLCLRKKKNKRAATKSRGDEMRAASFPTTAKTDRDAGDRQHKDDSAAATAAPPPLSGKAAEVYTNDLLERRHSRTSHRNGVSQKATVGRSAVPLQNSSGMHHSGQGSSITTAAPVSNGHSRITYANNFNRHRRAVRQASASAPPTPLRNDSEPHHARDPTGDPWSPRRRRESRHDLDRCQETKSDRQEHLGDSSSVGGSILEDIYQQQQHHRRHPLENDELQQDVVNITVAEDGRASFSMLSENDVGSSGGGDTALSRVRQAAEQRAATALSRLASLSRAELETKALELEAIVKTQRFEIEQLRSEVRIQRGMRTRGEQRQNDLHRLELKRLAEDTESEMKIALMETTRHPAEMLLEQRLMEVTQFQKMKRGGGSERGERKASRKDIAQLKRDVLAKGRATGQIPGESEEDVEEGGEAEDAFIEKLTAPVGPGGLPSPPSMRRGKRFVMPNDESLEHRDAPRDDDAFMEYLEGFQRKTTAMAEGLL